MALNKALKIAKGDLFGCVDADSCPAPDSLKHMIPNFENTIACFFV